MTGYRPVKQTIFGKNEDDRGKLLSTCDVEVQFSLRPFPKNIAEKHPVYAVLYGTYLSTQLVIARVRERHCSMVAQLTRLMEHT